MNDDDGARHAPVDTTAPAAHGGADEHEEPRYFLIWVVLAVLTLAEVGYAFLPLSRTLLAVGLILMAFWKAALVALYFMHLRYEPRRLWMLVTAPLPLVVILILAVITEY